MPTFLLTHQFPRDFQVSPETAAAARAWFARLAVNLTGRSTPTFEARQLGHCANEAERPVAYTLICADDLEAAVALAQSWPLLARGGGVEVRELTVMTPTTPASA
jgi:hypothetical protein